MKNTKPIATENSMAVVRNENRSNTEEIGHLENIMWNAHTLAHNFEI